MMTPTCQETAGATFPTATRRRLRRSGVRRGRRRCRAGRRSHPERVADFFECTRPGAVRPEGLGWCEALAVSGVVLVSGDASAVREAYPTAPLVFPLGHRGRPGFFGFLPQPPPGRVNRCAV